MLSPVPPVVLERAGEKFRGRCGAPLPTAPTVVPTFGSHRLTPEGRREVRDACGVQWRAEGTGRAAEDLWNRSSQSVPEGSEGNGHYRTRVSPRRQLIRSSALLSHEVDGP